MPFRKQNTGDLLAFLFLRCSDKWIEYYKARSEKNHLDCGLTILYKNGLLCIKVLEYMLQSWNCFT